ncbi:MAG: hypothetical protein WCA01_02680 [Burkholderiales bacterium]
MVDLRHEREQVEEIWARSLAPWLALPVAAAFTFHQTRRNVANLLTPAEYANALDIAAAALSCIIPIYTPDECGVPVPLPINLAQQRFCGGASGVQRADGAIVAPLSVLHGDVLPALVAIERSGIDYVAPKRLS